MQIELFRHPGYIGRLMPIDVLVDGKTVASIKTNETKILVIPDDGATLQVQLQGVVFSPSVHISNQDHGKRYECGNPLWTLFDILSFCYLPPLKHHVFFLRLSANNANISAPCV